MVIVALIAYVAATAVGMVVGHFAPFWEMAAPLVVFAYGTGAVVYFTTGNRAADTCGRRSDAWARGAAAGGTWGALAGAFATSTCGPTHARSFLGSDVAAVVVALVAIALVLVADMLPRAVATRPHALCGLLFLSTVGLALALGAEVPTWP